MSPFLLTTPTYWEVSALARLSKLPAVAGPSSFRREMIVRGSPPWVALPKEAPVRPNAHHLHGGIRPVGDPENFPSELILLEHTSEAPNFPMVAGRPTPKGPGENSLCKVHKASSTQLHDL